MTARKTAMRPLALQQLAASQSDETRPGPAETRIVCSDLNGPGG